MRLKRAFSLTTTILFFLFATSFANAEHVIDTSCGPSNFDQPVLKEALESKAMERIKGVDQSGPIVYFGIMPPFSRYDHSIAVLSLLQKAGVSIEEQLTGLLHDSSHTAFSHVGDNLFYSDNVEKSYQDTIHIWYLRHMGIGGIIEKYGISLESLEPDLSVYTALERPLPELCADRLQYNIHTGIMLDKISRQEGEDIVNDLQFKDDKWFFTNPSLARTFANLPLQFTQNFWGSEWNNAFYNLFSKALNRGVETNLISESELHFGVDKAILDKLLASNDSYIQKIMALCKDIHNAFTVVEYGKGDFNTKPKFRGIDPLVFTNGEYQKLSELDSEFKQEFDRVKAWCEKGYGIKISSDMALQ